MRQSWSKAQTNSQSVESIMHDEHWMTPNDAGNKQNVVVKRRVACAQFRINICAINMKMDSLNPLGVSTDVQLWQIDHQKQQFVLWAVQQQVH
jgi:hypothetical protein